MKRFNPEKELEKIQHRDRNKIIVFVFSLLIVGVIGYSFALYQVRYSKRIIYTKVAPFSTSDLDLAIYVDGKPDELPTKGTAYVDNIECDNTNNLLVYWDYDNWIMEIPQIEIPNKCKISFSKSPNLVNYLKYNDELIDDETIDHNLRYIGKDPDNYIWFNCDSYENLTQETAKTTCEKWRIIGIMNNITIVDGAGEETTNQTLVKIIRVDKIGDIAWDSSGSNNWTRPASLQTSLNSAYYKGTAVQDSKKGITAATKNMIEQVTWNVGSAIYNDVTAFQAYTASRIGLAWNGYIGLMYPSDYGYATSGGSSKNRSTCLAYNLYNWGGSGYKEDCAGNDWLWDSITTQWTLMTYSSYSDKAFSVRYTGGVAGSGSGPVTAAHAVRPALYLKSSVKVKSGTENGNSETPYILVP